MSYRDYAAALAALTAFALCQAQPCRAQEGTVLARDHPNAAVFLQMARRGILDYTAQLGRFPASLQAVQDGGYSAYLFPTNWHPLYQVRDAVARVGTYGEPVYFAGQPAKTYDITVTRPGPGLYHDIASDKPDTSTGSVRHVPGAARVWHFPGAQWLADGHSWPEVERALRCDRIATHLNWLTFEYNRACGSMPAGLHDLEAYLGTARDPLCWQGVTEVGSLATVSWQTGNLFAGWHHGAWVISINEGLTIDTHRWKPGTQGYYTSHSAIVY